MVTDRDLLEKIDRKIGKQSYTNMAFVLMAVSIALWGWGISKETDIYFYIGFIIWGIGFIILLINIFKK